MDKNKGCCDNCDSCGSCDKGSTCSADGSHGMGYCRLRWGTIAIKIAVALLVFWAGMQFGEQKAFMRIAQFDGFGGAGMMRGFGR